MKDAPLFAAIDLGSNAFRLMIGQSVRRNQQMVIQEVKTLREPVRLAEGFQGGALDELALDRGWQALARFGKKLRGFEAGRVRAVATSAVREAQNAPLFLASAERHLDFPSTSSPAMKKRNWSMPVSPTPCQGRKAHGWWWTSAVAPPS
jgi:exopolyphosphatase/guanosine-5'-triphosphate,3'-diphosphate pyrophosphatase